MTEETKAEKTKPAKAKREPKVKKAAVEPNFAQQSQKGFGEVYDSIQGFDDSPEPNQAYRPTVSGQTFISDFTADQPDSSIADQFDVESDAKAFARLICSKSVKPPLSVGVFGKWGTGKTFFMDLLSQSIEKIPKEDPQKEFFHHDIAQIKFNAWHYMDTNLWASIVDHIFKELDAWLNAAGKDNKQGEVEALFDHLSTAQQLKLQALEDLFVKKSETQNAHDALKAAEDSLEDSSAKVIEIGSLAYWMDLIKDAKGAGQGSPLHALLPDIQALAKSIDPKIGDGVEKIANLLEDGKKQSQRAYALWQSATGLLRHPLWWAVAVATVVVLPVGVYFLNIGATSPIDELVASISGVLTFLTATGAALLSKVKKIFDGAEKVRDQVQKLRDSATANPDDKYIDLRKAVKNAESAVDSAKSTLAQRQREFDQAMMDFQNDSTAGRLNRFIRAKARGDDYAKHLGIINMIRRDFAQLTELMNTDNEPDQAAFEAILKDYQEKIKKLEQKYNLKIEDCCQDENLLAKNVKMPQNTFKRIVLYIDDLDRCPANKVVQVLQAIHLLLYFPLFIVVVAVDARWVSKALKKHYPDLLEEQSLIIKERGEDGTAAISKSANGATTFDYLEKIFQIPYWTRKMDAHSRQEYAAYLISSHEEASGGEEEEHNPTHAELANMTFDEVEKECLKTFSAYAGNSPRRIIRFINIYRLIKSGLKQEIVYPEYSRDPIPHDMASAALICQLAMVNSDPADAHDFFALIGTSKQSSLSDLIMNLGSGVKRRQILEAYYEFLKKYQVSDGEMSIVALKATAKIAAKYSFANI